MWTRPANPRSAPLILCVDDYERALPVRRIILERAGYRVVTASDEAHALWLFRSLPVSLVMVEWLLKGDTASQLIRRMRQLRPDVPIMLYSAATELPNAPDADVFVSKLAPIEEVLAVIASLVEGPRSGADELPLAA